jgi:hypothetical protein
MRESAPPGALFDLGSSSADPDVSSEDADVAAHKDPYVGEAIEADVLRGSCD